MSREKIVLNDMQIKDIARCATKGLSLKAIAGYIGISKATLVRRLIDQPEAKIALQKGRANSTLEVASKAFEMAKSGEYPNMTMWWLKSRDRFNESDEMEDDDFNFPPPEYSF